MFKSLMSPVFVRLYASIILVFALLVMTAYVYWGYEESSTTVDDFIADTRVIAEPLLDVWHHQPEHWQTAAHIVSPVFNQKAEILTKSQLDKTVSAYEYVGKETDIQVYFSPQDDVMHAVYPVDTGRKYLMISDIAGADEDETNPQDIAHSQERRDRVARLILMGAGIGFFSFLAWGLLYILSGISRHVLTLSRVNQRFADGDLEARADPDMPAPFNQLAHSYNSMASRIKENIDDQKVMSHAIAHELRTPLTRLGLATSVAASKCKDPEVRPLFQSMETYIDELDALSDSILTLAKLNHRENKVLNRSEFDLQKLLLTRAEEAEALFPNKGVIHRHEAVVSIVADPFFVQVAVDNLLNNALRHCLRTVKVHIDSGLPESIDIIIEDDGEGIPQDQLALIFLPFARLDESRDRKSGGHGLGLAIVKGIAVRHGGSVRAEKSTLGGANFILSFPQNPMSKKEGLA